MQCIQFPGVTGLMTMIKHEEKRKRFQLKLQIEGGGK